MEPDIIENSIVKKYRKPIWNQFIGAIKDYKLISPGDRIAVCISGGKDSMLLAKCFRRLEKYSEIPFEAKYIVMNPGYSREALEKIKENAGILDIPIEFFDANIFKVVNKTEKSPCYLCARMRRGHLYNYAKEIGCNKIALGHHFNDVIETTVMGMFYGGELKAMLPKLKSTNFEGMELIRPLYLVKERDIIAWTKYNKLEFIRCACIVTQKDADGEHSSKRAEIKELIENLRQTNPNIEAGIFNSIHNVHIGTMPGIIKDGTKHSFLEQYDSALFTD